MTGFGTTEQNVLSDTLRATDTVIQNDTTCIAYSPNLYSKLLNEFTFCAGFGPNAGKYSFVSAFCLISKTELNFN